MKLDNIIRWMTPYKFANLSFANIGGILYTANFYQQIRAYNNEIPYEFYMGHSSGLTAVPLTSGLINTFFGPSLRAPIYTASLMTVGEILGIDNTRDFLDIPFYWAGAGLSYLPIMLGNSEKFSKLFYKVRSYRLDEKIEPTPTDL